MAEIQGIAKINGVLIANVAKDAGVAKANIWSIGNIRRQTSLFKSLSNQNWASYSQGVNQGSFTATGSSSSTAQVWFQVTGHTSGDTYQFDFTKGNTTPTKVFSCAASNSTAFDASSNTLNIPIPTGTGVQSVSVTYADTNSTIFLSISKVLQSSTESITIENLVVTRV